MKTIRRIAMLAALAFAVGCSNETVEVGTQMRNDVVGGSIEAFDDVTRAVVDDATLAGGSLSLKWSAGDEIGVYTSRNKNVKYTLATGAGTTDAKFTTSASVSSTPQYAYYPYNSGAGNYYSSVKGSIDENQEVADYNSVPGLVRYGAYSTTSNGQVSFNFKNLFSTVCFTVDANGTKLAGERVKSVQIKVVRNYFSSVPIVGDFTFNASTGSYSRSNTSNVVTYEFAKYPELNAENGNSLVFVASLFSTIKKNDRVNITVTTAAEGGGHTASFYVTSAVTMAQNTAYNFALEVQNGKSLSVKTNNHEVPEDLITPEPTPEPEPTPDPEEPTDPVEPENPTDPETPEGGDDNGDDNGNTGEGGDDNTGDNTGNDNTGDNTGEGGNTDVPTAPVEPEPTPEPEPEPQPEVVTGNFTCATYNVDGLPKKISLVTINGDGPQESGTTAIGTAINASNWDFVGFSEDFAFHSQLTSNMSNYTFGTHRGSVSSSALYKTLDTDGLEFATKNGSCSFGNTESWTQFSSSYGGLTSGANTCIKKGIRHYVVTLADGIEVDVIITHMNTYSSSGSGHINAQHAQLKQIAQYINTISANGRPIIFMGDTNCRYTRHDFKTYFWSVLNSDLTYADPWVDFQWNGVYPTYPSKSLMVSDATGTDSSTDIICADTQQGEVVDKVIYINKASNKVQLKAKSYLRDMSFDKADHKPIVVEFEYSYTK